MFIQFIAIQQHISDDSGIFRPEVLQTIEEELDNITGELRELSLKIHCEQSSGDGSKGYTETSP